MSEGKILAVWAENAWPDNPTELEYRRLLTTILMKGRVKKNRTGVNTIGVFGDQAKFDLSKGFPILTTKKVWFKGIVHELLWFIRGDTNIKYLVDNNVHIWDEWRKPYRFNRKMVFITPIEKSYTSYTGNYSWEGYNISTAEDIQLAYIWVHILKRCYDTSHHNYKYYGGKGVSVHADWHNPQTFIKDVKRLPHWFYKQKNWHEFELDKDYFGSKQYGPDTCVWLHTKENNFYTTQTKPVEIKDSDGEISIFISGNAAAESLGMSSTSFHRFLQNGLPTILKGNNKKFIGWEFNELELGGKLARLELIDKYELGEGTYGGLWRNFETVDQLKNVIEKLKTNPDDRRMIVSSWHPYWVEKCALPPCHCFFQFHTEELTLKERQQVASSNLEYGRNVPSTGLHIPTDLLTEKQLDELDTPKRRLNLQMYQRSCDTFLGVPFNITSYSLLLAMVAQVVDMIPGVFTHTYGDLHIYENHVDQVKEQLSRTPKSFPTLSLNPKIKDLFDFKFEDINLLNYYPHPAIKGEVAV